MVIEIGSLLLLAAIAIILYYTFSMFRDWVKVNIGNLRTRQIVSGLVRQRLENGNNKVVPFLFDQDAKKYVKAEAYEAKILDETLEEKLEEKDFFIEKPISYMK